MAEVRFCKNNRIAIAEARSLDVQLGARVPTSDSKKCPYFARGVEHVEWTPEKGPRAGLTDVCFGSGSLGTFSGLPPVDSAKTS
jgi:hypothetical protein